MHDWYCVLLSPFVVVAFRPAVFSNLMLVVLVVKEVDKAYDNLGIEIVPTWYIFLMKRMGMSS